MTINRALSAMLIVSAATASAQAQFFIAQSSASVVARKADLTNFPTVTYQNLFAFEAIGAARGPGDLVYLCNGDFTTKLYTWDQKTAPKAGPTLQVAMHGLAYAKDTLFGYANFAPSIGVYRIDPANGTCTLAVDTTPQGYRFFAIDGDQSTGKLYGFTEYGSPTGLYEIDVDHGTLTFLAATPPGSYGMFRAMAVGNGTAYLLGAHPTDTFYAYDLSQGPGGKYVAFTNPFPDSLNGGGAWLGPIDAPCQPDCDENGTLNIDDFICFQTLFALGDPAADCDGSSSLNIDDFICFQTLFALGC
jgi:hypothetical protein